VPCNNARDGPAPAVALDQAALTAVQCKCNAHDGPVALTALDSVPGTTDVLEGGADYPDNDVTQV
jgi:hypothetical protein